MGFSGNSRLASFLVRRRWILVALTAALSVVSAILIPHVRINSDVTTYLPDDSPMRHGLSIVAEHLPSLDIRRQTIRLVFPCAEPSDSLQAAVEGLLEDPQLPDIRLGEWRAGAASRRALGSDAGSGASSGSALAAYYQYSLPRDTDGARVKAVFRERFGDRVIVEIEDNTGMPEGVPRMITIGFILIFLILVVMCPSFVEALLFMFTIGIAILINMGTNALLRDVSMITNALSSVLQMALSLDYAIILSNRYRQARMECGASLHASSGRYDGVVPGGNSVVSGGGSVISSGGEAGVEKSSPLSAMTSAVARALPSVLASALTTIASLLMLCFMRLRFGMDLGVVLSKGVLCSLLCTFMLLPAMLLALDKAIAKTSKRVPLIPTDGIARFEHRFRVPIAIGFLALFAGAYFLQRRVPVYYSMTRATDITRAFPPKNTMLLIYPTAEEQALLPMLDKMGIVPVAVPGMAALAPGTAAPAPEMTAHVSEMTAPAPEMIANAPETEGQGAKSAQNAPCPLPETGASNKNGPKCALPPSSSSGPFRSGNGPASEPGVAVTALSYPAIALTPRTAGEWRALLSSLPGITQPALSPSSGGPSVDLSGHMRNSHSEASDVQTFSGDPSVDLSGHIQDSLSEASDMQTSSGGSSVDCSGSVKDSFSEVSDVRSTAVGSPEAQEILPDEALGLLFYAATHPERDERFALSELRMPPGYGKPLDIAGLMASDGRDTPGHDGKATPGHDEIGIPGHDGKEDVTNRAQKGVPSYVQATSDTLSSSQGSSLESAAGKEISPRGASSLGRNDRNGASQVRDNSVGEATDTSPSFQDSLLSFQGPLPSFQGSSLESLPYTYEGLHQQRTVAGMHQYLGVEMRALRIIYRMERPRQSLETATMSAVETMDAVNKKILSNKVYAAMIPKDKAVALRQMQQDFNAVLAAGPTASDGRDTPGHDVKATPGPDEKATPGTLPSFQGSSLESAVGKEISPRGTSSLGRDDKGGASLVRDDKNAAAQVRDESEGEATSTLPSFQGSSLESGAEDLAILALSGKKCTAERCYKALHRAGVAVSREEIALLYLYNGYLSAADTTQRLSLVEMLSCLDSLAARPLAASFIDSTRRAELTGLRGQLDTQLGLLRSGQWSAAVLQSALPEEGGETYAFIGALRNRCAETFKGETYIAGYSVMYDEMKDSFPRELLMVTLLTALIIFLIVAITFRRPFIALILVAVVMTAVWLDVFLSGLGGKPILFMAYFIVQSILMGATIDYSILLTHYYRESRRTEDIATSLRAAYRGSIHTIMTSGLIITLGTWVMTFVISDPVIVPVLRSISSGSLIAILLILFVLPALLSLLDRFIIPRRP